MAKCKNCGAETELYSADIPMCLACVEAEDLKRGREVSEPKDKEETPPDPEKSV
jgi:hypothetical protein